MKRYAIYFSRSAEKSLKALPKILSDRLTQAIQALAYNPHPAGSKKMAGSHATYRIRIQNYRVVYEVDQGQVIVLVLKIAHRR